MAVLAERYSLPVGAYSPLPPRPQLFISSSSAPYTHTIRRVQANAIRSPKGFGPQLPTRKKSQSPSEKDRWDQEERAISDDEEADEVPELVTNRMLRRIGFTVGIPLAVGLLFFPLFYYLKVVLKLDVPQVLPVIVSGALFGLSGFGITYGIISTSWDPLREGSVLGWTEAKANWPVFVQGFQGKQGKKRQ